MHPIITVIIAVFLPLNNLRPVFSLNWDLTGWEKKSCDSIFFYPLASIVPSCRHEANILSHLTTVITRNGYHVETHKVTGKSGYIITLFRIPPKSEGGQPVFVHHGVLNNPADFANKINNSLAYTLHDSGYDVWMTNVRGTTYSKENINSSYTENKFWNFNLDNIASEDIPPQMEYISKISNQTGRIIYIGHSMGTTLSFMYASSNPSHAGEHLKGVISLAPVAFLLKPRTYIIFKLIIPFPGLIRGVLKLLGIRSLFAYSNLMHNFMVFLCKMAPPICLLINRVKEGPLSGQFAAKDWLLYFSNWPDSTSVDQLIQYLQITGAGELLHFDHGAAENQKLYGQKKPPPYSLGNITLPWHIFYGLNDALVSVEEAKIIFNQLGSRNKKITQMSVDGKVKFNHMDFEMGKDANTLLFPYILDAIQTINES